MLLRSLKVRTFSLTVKHKCRFAYKGSDGVPSLADTFSRLFEAKTYHQILLTFFFYKTPSGVGEGTNWKSRESRLTHSSLIGLPSACTDLTGEQKSTNCSTSDQKTEHLRVYHSHAQEIPPSPDPHSTLSLDMKRVNTPLSTKETVSGPSHKPDVKLTRCYYQQHPTQDRWLLKAWPKQLIKVSIVITFIFIPVTLKLTALNTRSLNDQLTRPQLLAKSLNYSS